MRTKSWLWISVLALLTSVTPALAARHDQDRDDRGYNSSERDNEREWRDYLKNRNKAYKEWSKASRKEQKEFETYIRDRDRDRPEAARDYREGSREGRNERWEDQHERDNEWREYLRQRNRGYIDYSRASRQDLDDFYIYLRDRGYRYDDRYGNWGRYAGPRDGACFYTDSEYRGESFCLDRDESLRFVGDRYNDRISSIRIFGRARVEVYKHKNYEGSHRTYTDDAPHLGGFNDEISAIKVR